MSFNIEHETDSKNLIVDPIDNDDDFDIKFDRKSPNQVFLNDPSKFNSEQPIDNGLDFMINPNKRNLIVDDHSDVGPSISEAGESNSVYMNEHYTKKQSDNNSVTFGMSFDEVLQKKAFYLTKLKGLESQGYVTSRRLGIEHSLADIQGEYVRIKKEKDLKSGVEGCKSLLMGVVVGVELLTQKFAPEGDELDGWSMVMAAEKDQYDDVLEELYEKYSTRYDMGPEMRLVRMVSTSALMFHLNKRKVMGMDTNNFMKMARGAPQPEMKGPSFNYDDMLDEDYSVSGSEIDSIVSGYTNASRYTNNSGLDINVNKKSATIGKNIIVPKKKRGRPKKNI